MMELSNQCTLSDLDTHKTSAMKYLSIPPITTGNWMQVKAAA